MEGGSFHTIISFITEWEKSVIFGWGGLFNGYLGVLQGGCCIELGGGHFQKVCTVSQCMMEVIQEQASHFLLLEFPLQAKKMHSLIPSFLRMSHLLTKITMNA